MAELTIRTIRFDDVCLNCGTRYATGPDGPRNFDACERCPGFAQAVAAGADVWPLCGAEEGCLVAVRHDGDRCVRHGGPPWHR